jgi:hypothetical protein
MGINQIHESYLVIGPSSYKDSVTDFIQWKKEAGYYMYSKFDSSWTTDLIKQTIDSVYHNVSNLKYVLILGDNDAMPAIAETYGGYNYVTDFHYACINNDTAPDLYIGRIPGKDATDIKNALTKIVDIEKNPVSDSSYYNKMLLNAYFQSENKSKTSRNFVETCERIRNYVTDFGIDGIRNYYAQSEVNPKYWRSGEEIPEELQRPNFAWDGNANTITSTINDGCNIVVTRTHGNVTRWGYVDYDVDDVALLNNSKYPIVYSLSCLTGKFDTPEESLCQALLSKKDSGSAAVIGATERSYTNLNDCYALGIINHLWPNPGIDTPFIDNGDNPVEGFTTKYGPTLAETLEAGKRRMLNRYPNSNMTTYQEKIYHIFGDPSMWIHTEQPTDFDVNVSVSYLKSLSQNEMTPQLKVSLGDESGLISIIDAEDNQYTFFGKSAMLTSPLFPCNITVSGFNKNVKTLTYQSQTSTSNDDTPYRISSVKVNKSTQLTVYTEGSSTKNSVSNFALVLYNLKGDLLTSTDIDITENQHSIKTPTLTSGESYILILLKNGSGIDNYTFVAKF